jgi:hypothetical protein
MWLLPDLERHFADYSELTPDRRVFVGPTGVTPGPTELLTDLGAGLGEGRTDRHPSARPAPHRKPSGRHLGRFDSQVDGPDGARERQRCADLSARACGRGRRSGCLCRRTGIASRRLTRDLRITRVVNPTGGRGILDSPSAQARQRVVTSRIPRSASAAEEDRAGPRHSHPAETLPVALADGFGRGEMRAVVDPATLFAVALAGIGPRTHPTAGTADACMPCQLGSPQVRS